MPARILRQVIGPVLVDESADSRKGQMELDYRWNSMFVGDIFFWLERESLLIGSPRFLKPTVSSVRYIFAE